MRPAGFGGDEFLFQGDDADEQVAITERMGHGYLVYLASGKGATRGGRRRG